MSDKPICQGSQMFNITGASKDEKDMLIEMLKECITDELDDWWDRKQRARKPFIVDISITERQ